MNEIVTINKETYVRCVECGVSCLKEANATSSSNPVSKGGWGAICPMCSAVFGENEDGTYHHSSELVKELIAILGGVKK